MANQVEFGREIKNYLKQCVKPNGSRYTQVDLAAEIGGDPSELNRKLNGQVKVGLYEVEAIIKTLVSIEAITTRQQARELLGLVGYSDFTPAQWGAKPLNQLVDNPQSTTHQGEVIMDGSGSSTSPDFSEYAQLIQNRDALIKKLLRCPALAYLSGIQQIVKQLPEDIQFEIVYPDNANLVQRMGQIVDACLATPGGMQILVQLVASFDKKTIQFGELIKFLNSNKFYPKL